MPGTVRSAQSEREERSEKVVYGAIIPTSLPALRQMKTDEQGKRSLRLIGDSFKKIVIVNKVMKPYMDDDGILTMGLFDFLLNPGSLDLV